MYRKSQHNSETSTIAPEAFGFFNYKQESTKNIHFQHNKFLLWYSCNIGIACGKEDFLKLLSKNGITGVNIDENTYEDTRVRVLDYIYEDIFNYLENLSPESFDGIFISHFIKHLESEKLSPLLNSDLYV